jgi:3-methylfumaryl-CoA hydratase
VPRDAVVLVSVQSIGNIAAWIGREERVEDSLAPEQSLAAAAMLDRDPSPFAPGAPLPPLWHWFHFLPRAPQSRLAPDGHPERGGFLPPIPLPRRMFAGARLVFHRPLTLGQQAVREGTILDVAEKQGKSGALAFVTVRYRYVQGGVICIEEEQDIVYRGQGRAVPAPVEQPLPPLPEEAWTRSVTPDSRMLFRFSALTFNAHRIHYDRPYAMQEEAYPGLVVHGPLIAVLLADLVRRHDRRPLARFRFRGLAPLFDFGPVRLSGVPQGDAVTLAAHAIDATRTMDAEATLGTTTETETVEPALDLGAFRHEAIKAVQRTAGSDAVRDVFDDEETV